MDTQAVATTSLKLTMGKPAPDLTVKTLDGSDWNLADQPTDKYKMIVFYRGLHCPICQKYIAQVQEKLSAFQELGVEVIAISGDGLDRAQQFKTDAAIANLTLGYGLTRDDMHRWGLYLSKGHFENEPALFNEPATFIIKPDGRLYYDNIGTHPFSRPDLDLLLMGLDYIIKHDYPFRGTEW